VLSRFLKSEDGTTTAEYGVLLALLVCACLASILALTPAAGATFGATTTVVGTHGVP
jgi:Flp pilus assembly pilin Flp